MEFVQLKEKEYLDYAINHPYFSFYQTPGQIKVKSLANWEGFLVGIKDNDKVLACATLIRKKLPYINKYLFYSPRGLLVDYDNKELLSFFTKELKNFVKKNNGFLLIIDPYVFNVERDKNGEPIDGGYNNANLVDNLKASGFKHTGFNLGYENLQTRWISVINLKGKTYEDIEKDFSKAKRKQAKQLYLYGVYTEAISSKEDLAIFAELESAIGEKRGFFTRPKKYYDMMWDCFYPEFMLITLTKINFKNAITRTQEAIDSILKERKDTEEKLAQKKISLNMDRYKAKCIEEDKLIENYKESLALFNECLDKYGEETTISAHQYMLSKKEIICLASGNNEELVRYHGDISAYIWGIKYALEHKMERFNMYGISGNFNKENNPHYGYYALKKEFGGVVVDLLGEFHLVISPFWTFAYKIAKKIFVRNL